MSYRRRPERSGARLWLTLVTLLLLAAVVGAPVAVAYRVLHPGGGPANGQAPAPTGEPVGFWGVPGRAPLQGWYLAGGDRAVVLVHGHGGNAPWRADLARALHAAGFSVLLYDQRGHGASAGVGNATFGARETGDLVQAIELARSKGARSVALLGWDLGANVALKVAASRPEVSAVVLDNPAGDPAAAAQRLIAGASPLPEFFFATYTRWMAGLLYGARPGELRPLAEASQLGTHPLLVIAPEVGAPGPLQVLHAYGRPGAELLVAPDRSSPLYVQKVVSFLSQAK